MQADSRHHADSPGTQIQRPRGYLQRGTWWYYWPSEGRCRQSLDLSRSADRPRRNRPGGASGAVVGWAGASSVGCSASRSSPGSHRGVCQPDSALSPADSLASPCSRCFLGEKKPHLNARVRAELCGLEPTPPSHRPCASACSPMVLTAILVPKIHDFIRAGHPADQVAQSPGPFRALEWTGRLEAVNSFRPHRAPVPGARPQAAFCFTPLSTVDSRALLSWSPLGLVGRLWVSCRAPLGAGAAQFQYIRDTGQDQGLQLRLGVCRRPLQVALPAPTPPKLPGETQIPHFRFHWCKVLSLDIAPTAAWTSTKGQDLLSTCLGWASCRVVPQG